MDITKTQKKEEIHRALSALDNRERRLRKSMILIICLSYFLFASQNIFLDSLGIGEGLRLAHQAGAMKFLLLFMAIILLPTTLFLGGFFFWYLGPMEKLYRSKFRGEPVDRATEEKGMARFRHFSTVHNLLLVLLYLLQTLSGMRFADKNGMGIFLDLFPKINFALELMIFSWVMNEFFALRPFRLAIGIYRVEKRPFILRSNTVQTFAIPLLFIVNSQIVMIDGVVKMYMGSVSRFQVNQETLSRLFRFLAPAGGIPEGGAGLSGAAATLSAGDPRIIGAVAGGLTILMFLTLLPALAVFPALAAFQRVKLRDLESKVTELARGSGDLTKQIRIQGEDELGIITSSLNEFIENLRQKLLLLSRSASRVTQSTDRMNTHLQNTSAATEEMAASVNQINRTTVSRTETVSQTGETLLSLVESLDRVSSSVENQAAFVDQTSSAVNEMAASIASVTLSAKKASDLSRHLRTAAKEGEKAVTQSIGAVKAVESSSEEVNSLVTLITETAETTNLLAMNAAIEAAHAGEAGKGFAVVADEVRRLAVDSSDGARQITGQVQTMVDVVGKGVRLSEEAGLSLGRVIQDVEETSQVMEDIALAMDEQNTGANEILKSITSLVDATSTIREVTAEQRARNETMRRSVDLIVQAFNEIKVATDEQSQGTREIVDLITALQSVAGENREVVETLEKAFSGFKLS